MIYGLVRLTAPALEPLSLTEVKAHLRVDGNEEDAYIASLLAAARELTESLTGRAMITQTFEMSLDGWRDDGRAVELPRAPVQSVSVIEIVDDAGVRQSVDTDSFELDLARTPARILRKPGASWPVPGPCLGGIKVTFVAGFGDAGGDVPSGLRQAILMVVAHWFERREAAVAKGLAGLPFGITSLVQPYLAVRL